MTNYPLFSPRRSAEIAPGGFQSPGAILSSSLSDFIFHFLQKNPLDRTAFLLQYIFLEVFQIFCIRVR